MNHVIEIRSLNLKPGTREAMLALIENYTDIVFELDEVTVQGLQAY